MQPFAWHRIARLTASLAFTAGLLVCLHFSHVHESTAALLMVLGVMAIAALSGSLEALAAAVAAGIGFAVMWAPSPGLALRMPDHWFALAAFCGVGTLTGRMSALSRHRRRQADRGEREMEMLYRLVNALLEAGGPELALPQVAAKLVEILEVDGIALYDQHSGDIVRAGKRAAAIKDRALFEAASTRRPFFDPLARVSITPIRYGQEFAGSVGISGAELSPPLLKAVAARVGMGLARIYAIENTMEVELSRRSEELKAAVLDSLAHELRAPLNTIRIAATTLLSAEPDHNPQQEMLSIIDEEVSRMDRFIEEAMQLARMQANELTLKTAPNDIARLIPVAIEALGPAAAHRPIDVRIPGYLPPAECDADMILRVLNQLLNNAIKYSPADSPITLSANLDGRAIVIDVIDAGPGVGEDERERIFERHYRGRAARLGAAGTGVGLASAKCIVEAHGGEIWVTSPPDGGAAFHLSLPAVLRPIGVL